MAAETSFDFTQLPPLRVPSFPFAFTETSFDNGSSTLELGGEQLPFRLSVAKVGASSYEWSVSSKKSSVTDGTNGDPINLAAVAFDTGHGVSAEKVIVLKATVGADLVIDPDTWTLAPVAAADAVEVGFDAAEPPAQNLIQLVIGKVKFENGEASSVQAVFTAQRITHGFLNGTMVKVFESAPVHPNDL